MLTKKLVKVFLKKPKKDLDFFKNIGSKWLVLNLSIIIFWAWVYMHIDKKERSIFRGMKGTEKTFFDYFYFSVIITSTLGLGEIVPDPEADRNDTIKGRTAVMIHILSALFLNDLLDSYENLILS